MFKLVQRIRDRKKRKGMLFIEIVVVLGLVIAITSWVFMKYSNSQITSRITQMHNDLRTISTAAVAYSASALDGSFPSTVSEAGFTLPAANSRTGIEEKFLPKDMPDPWGGTYTIDTTNRTVSCAGSQKEKVPATKKDF